MIKKITIIAILIITKLCFADGIVKGMITDARTGEPLMGANVVIVNNDNKSEFFGSASDINGMYLITQVPSGTYTMTVTFISYSKYTVREVKVSSNRMTKIDAKMEVEAISGQEVIVTADRPAVDVKTANSSQMISSEEIERMPVMTSATDLFAMQAGVVKVDDAIHVRGGRSDEVLYLVDGVPVNDPITGVNAVDIDINQIKEVEIIKGGFDARYGNAQSAIINIITKSGKEYIDVDFHTKTDQFSSGKNEGYTYTYLGINGPLNFLPGDGSFSTTLSTDLKDGYHHMGGDYGETDFGLFSIPNNQHTNYKGSAAIDYKPTKKIRLNLKYRYQNSFDKGYNYSWKDLPDRVGIGTSRVSQYTMIFNHSLQENTYYRLTISQQGVDSYGGLMGLKNPQDMWGYNLKLMGFDENKLWSKWGTIPGLIHYYDSLGISDEDILWSFTNPAYIGPEEDLDEDKDHFMDYGVTKGYNTSRSDVWDFDFQFVKHIAKIHKFEFGANFQHKNINYLSISGYNNYYPDRDSLPGDFPRYGSTRWYFNDSPQRGSWYFQDRIDYAGMYLLLGMRADYYIHGETINSDEYIAAFNRAAGTDIKAFDRVKVAYSPRFGLSIPANLNTKVFFNYGYFAQQPSFQEMYLDPFLNGAIGNPDLDPRKSISYEVGVETEFIKDYVMRVKIFGKDYAGGIGLRQTETEPINVVYQNTGFGSSRGFETEFRKEYSNYFALTANYTFSLARGFDLSALDAYQRGETVPPPVRAQRVGYDINHVANFTFSFHVPETKPLNLFGAYLKDFSLNMLGSYYSGYPYTPVIPNQIYIETNTETGPRIYTLDADLQKGFRMGKFRFRFFVEAKNLLNIRNLNLGSGYNYRTGKVLDYGDLSGTSDQYLMYPDLLYYRGIDTYSWARLVRLGIKINFN
ncbi:MAG: TonB-dependent receptor [Candidatus Marinimicrobia bacterium]|nr:TonB-dependent receptor [Candidatus Neomarinimicrobiota bacterium]